MRIFLFSFYGIDFSDEGRHINEIKYTNTYTWAASQYGYVIQPIAKLLDYNIPALRILNIAFTFLLSAVVFYMHYENSKSKLRESKALIISFCLSFGVLGLSFFNVWLPTPSYYSLTFQSLLIFWISFKYVNMDTRQYASLAKISLLSLSSALVFLAKPTSFLIIWLISIVSMCVFLRNRIFSILSYNLLLLIVLLLYSWMTFGHPLDLINRVTKASRLLAIQDPLYQLNNLLRLDPFPFSSKLTLLLLGFGVVVTLLIGSCLSIPRKFSIHRFLVFLLSFVLLVFVFLNDFNFNSNPLFLLMSSIFLSICLRLFYISKIHKPFKFRLNSNIGLLFLPFAFAFGTNGNLWIASSQTIFFLVIFSWALIQGIENNLASKISQIIFITLCLPIGFLSIEYGISHPYRQQSLETTQISNPIKDERLGNVLIPEVTAIELQKMYQSVESTGFKPEQPIIDLSGQSPLAIYALNGYPVGSPWMVGGYLGSNKLAKKVLSEVSCKTLIESWILIEPGGPRALNIKYVLKSFGANLEDYEIVAKWNTPKGAGGYVEQRLQNLLKPKSFLSTVRKKNCDRTKPA